MKIFTISSSVRLKIMILLRVSGCKKECFAVICCLPDAAHVVDKQLRRPVPNHSYRWLISRFFFLPWLCFLMKKCMWYLNNALFARLGEFWACAQMSGRNISVWVSYSFAYVKSHHGFLSEACFRYILHVPFSQRNYFPLFLQIKTPDIVSSSLTGAADAGFKFFPAVSCQATATQLHLQAAGFVHCPIPGQRSENSIHASWILWPERVGAGKCQPAHPAGGQCSPVLIWPSSVWWWFVFGFLCFWCNLLVCFSMYRCSWGSVDCLLQSL